MPHQSDYLRALFENLPIAVLLADDQARYVDANAAACELLERTRANLIGARVSDVIAAGREAEVSVQWKAFLRDGRQSGVFEFVLPSGASRRAHFHAVANFAPGLHCSFMSPVLDSTAANPERDALLTMCAWTKQVQVGEKWMSIERYLSENHSLQISHGVAPDAFARLTRELRDD